MGELGFYLCGLVTGASLMMIGLSVKARRDLAGFTREAWADGYDYGRAAFAEREADLVYAAGFDSGYERALREQEIDAAVGVEPAFDADAELAEYVKEVEQDG